jgi:hypothetical protein
MYNKTTNFILWLIFAISSTGIVISAAMLISIEQGAEHIIEECEDCSNRGWICTIVARVEHPFANEILWGAIGVSASTLIGIIVNFSQRRRVFAQNKPLCCSCSETGILKIYPKRRGGGDAAEEYRSDLYNEFKSLQHKHTKKLNPVPIKIIGVALESYFGDPNAVDLSAMIEECVRDRNAEVNVLICDYENNNELKFRYNTIKESLNGTLLEDTSLVTDIKVSVGRLTTLQNGRGRLSFHKYCFAPYATIVFVNNHIYYTPNMTLFEDEIAKIRDEDNEKNELTFCIERESKSGRKLVDLFDEQWDYENSDDDINETDLSSQNYANDVTAMAQIAEE